MELRLLEKGTILSVLVKNGNCYSQHLDPSDYTTFLGTISKENFSWIGNVEVFDGTMDLVVLECEEGKPIVFSKKHLTNVEDLAITSKDIQFLLDKIDNLEKTISHLEYLDSRY